MPWYIWIFIVDAVLLVGVLGLRFVVKRREASVKKNRGCSNGGFNTGRPA